MALRLHAYWHNDQLFLWGERLVNGEGSAPPRADELRAAAGELSPDALLASVATDCQSTLWLPCDEHGPISSVIAQGAAVSGTDNGATVLTGELRAVTVTCLAFSPAQTIDLLTSLPRELPALCGPSVAYWTMLAGFVVDLLARRQFVPHLDDTDAGYISRWQPVVQDREELAWLEQFAVSMPAVC